MTLTIISIIIWGMFTLWILFNNVLLARAVKTLQRIILIQESVIAGKAIQKQEEPAKAAPQIKTAGGNEKKDNSSDAQGGSQPRKIGTKRAGAVGKKATKKQG